MKALGKNDSEQLPIDALQLMLGLAVGRAPIPVGEEMSALELFE